VGRSERTRQHRFDLAVQVLPFVVTLLRAEDPQRRLCLPRLDRRPQSSARPRVPRSDAGREMGSRQLAADERARRCATQEALEGPGGKGRAVKILGVVANNRKHAFEVRTSRQTLVFPYTKADPAPLSTDRIAEVIVDPELGREGFTYRLASGAEGSVHIDAVLEYNEDPSYMAELTLYRLTEEARSRFEASGLSAREVSRWLGTSPTQLYRLLDPTNYSKSLRQLISLLYILGCEVDVEVRERPRRRVAS
jgi:hypothetical protein